MSQDQVISEKNENYRPKPMKKRQASGLAACSGLLLIIVGLAFLMKNSGFLGPRFNWWSFFILVPAIGALYTGLFIFQRRERFNVGVRLFMSLGLVSLTVALMFLLDLDWSVWWPLMLLVSGLGLIPISMSHDLRKGIQLSSLLSLGFWAGLASLGLGVGFLAQKVFALNLNALFGGYIWWGFFILLPGLGMILSSFLNYLKSGHRTNAQNVILLLFGLLCCCNGVIAVLHLPWNLGTPLILIVMGILFLLKYFQDLKQTAK